MNIYNSSFKLDIAFQIAMKGELKWALQKGH